MSGSSFEPARVLSDLQELRRLTASESGADRLCWTPGWQRARQWLRDRLATLPCTVEQDAAGNLWATLEGDRPAALVVGSHIDSVPGGGWLDGALGVMVALEVLRSRSHGPRPVTLRFVDWADEEGARFGTSLFGSSGASGSLDVAALRDLQDADGELLPVVLRENGVELERVLEASRELDEVAAYLELHIEQGPVLEQRDLPVAAVSGTQGIRRSLARFRGRGGHAGGVPMELREDVLVAASHLVLAVQRAAEDHGCLGTVGTIRATPSVPTAVNLECEVSIDLRALDQEVLDAVAAEVSEVARAIAQKVGVSCEWTELMSLEPIPFDPELVKLAEAAARETVVEAGLAGDRLVVPSGALHDATILATRVPTAMLFTSSTDGISHTPEEDTPEEHLLLAASAYDRLVSATEAFLVERDPG